MYKDILPNNILSALDTLYKIIDQQDFYWILSGSTSLKIQGVDVEPHDIDIVTNREGSKAIDKLLAEYKIKTPRLVESEKMKSYWGTYEIDGIGIDTVADFQYRLKDGYWSKIRDLREVKKIKYGDMVLPVLSLEEELVEYESMGREDKVEKIRQAIATKVDK